MWKLLQPPAYKPEMEADKVDAKYKRMRLQVFLGIFTDTTISLRSWLRQRPDHYTIRAGRNLPDKEFRYLRTVIVTAAVYRGFNSMLPPKSNISS